MSRRTFLYSALKNDPTLQGWVGDRIYQSASMTTAQTVKPFIIYHIGNNTSENLAEDHPANRYFFQIYIYDDGGDYTRIDNIGDRVKALLSGASSPQDKIINTRFLERSQDLNDETLRAIFNYLRFQWVLGG